MAKKRRRSVRRNKSIKVVSTNEFDSRINLPFVPHTGLSLVPRERVAYPVIHNQSLPFRHIAIGCLVILLMAVVAYVLGGNL